MTIASPKANISIIETSNNKTYGPPNASIHLLPSPLAITNVTNLSATSRNIKKLSIGPAKDPTATNLEHTSSNNKQSINPEPVVGTNKKAFTPIVAVVPTTTIDNHTIRQPNRKKLPSLLPNANVTKILAPGRNNEHLSTNSTKAPTANNLEHASPNKN